MSTLRIAAYRWICLIFSFRIRMATSQFVLAADRGALRLDKWTLPKMVELAVNSPHQVLLVRFGRPYAFEQSMKEHATMDQDQLRQETAGARERAMNRMGAGSMDPSGHLDGAQFPMAQQIMSNHPELCDDPAYREVCGGMTAAEVKHYRANKHLSKDVMVMLTDRMYNTSNLIMAEVWMSHGDDPYFAEHLEDLYDLDSDKLPAYLIWSQKYPKGDQYNGAESFEDISMWLDMKTDIDVPHETLPVLDKLVHLFFHGETQDGHKDRALKAMRKQGDLVRDSKSKHYVNTMEKIIQRGNDHIQKEMDRIGEILHAKLPADARADFTDKMKVLTSYKKIMHREL